MFYNLWLISSIILVVGAVSTAAGAVLKYYAGKEEQYRGHAEAKVVNILTEPRTGAASLSEFRNRQVAVFEFFANGKLIKVRDEADTYPCPYAINQRVRIGYDPENPADYRIEPRNKKMKWASVLNSLGVVEILVGCLLFLMYAARIDI